MKKVKKTLFCIGIVALIATNFISISNKGSNDISLSNIINSAVAQSEDTGNNANIYYSTNPINKSGEYTDEYGVKWCWTETGDYCNKKGNNCPNGVSSNYSAKKC